MPRLLADVHLTRSAKLLTGYLILIGSIMMTSCSTDQPRPVEEPGSRHEDSATHSENPTQAVRRYRYRVIRTLPHDKTAFTQGLVVFNGRFMESTGQNGMSSLRIVDIPTGKVVKRHSLESMYFGEGMCVIGNKAYMITWLNQQGFVFDARTLKQTDTFRYNGEGWGLTSDGTHLYMSNGSDVITVRDPKDFRVTRSIKVTNNGSPQNKLNELEWIDGEIWANVWRSDDILRIDAASGKVTGVVDMTGLLPLAEQDSQTDVLNGIAYDSLAKSLYITGKNWPHVYEVAVE